MRDLPAARVVYERLIAAFGPQGWWPAETAFEVAVGAVLTQNTAWINVEQAIDRLRARRLLALRPMLNASVADLAQTIRPAGYFNVKARRLRNLCTALDAAGGLHALAGWETERLRAWLLAISGVGPETADAILLYCFGRPVFVIDAYARRIFARLGQIGGAEPYEVLRQAFERVLEPEAAIFSDYHALLVELGKRHCRPQPRCGGCPLQGDCSFGRGPFGGSGAPSRAAARPQ